MNFRLFASLIVLTVLRFVYIGNVGLLPDEAYYHEWSQRLDWWYFSKGPGIAFIIRAGTALFGHTEFGIRFFAPFFGLGTTLLVHWLAKRIYDARVAFWTVVVMCVSPIFNAGALLMTIDAPSIFFWAASLCTLWLALEKSPAFSCWWVLTGLLTGVGFLCKMTNAAIFVSVFLLIIMTPRYRGELIGSGWLAMRFAIWIALTAIAIKIGFFDIEKLGLFEIKVWMVGREVPVLNLGTLISATLFGLLTPRKRADYVGAGSFVMLLVFIPFIIPAVLWNQSHGWPTTTHLAARGGLDAVWWNFDFGAFVEFVGYQFGVHSPFIFFTMMMALIATTAPSFGRWFAALGRSMIKFPASLRSSWIGWAALVLLLLALWMAGNFFERTGFYLAGKIVAVLSAILFIGAHKEAANIQWKSRFLAAFALPLLLTYAWIGLHHKTQPNWTAPAIVSLVILTTSYALDRVLRDLWGARRFTVAAIALGAVISIVMVNTDALRMIGIPLPYKRDPGARMVGWREVANDVAKFRETIERESGQKVFLIANSYGTAAELCFYLPEKRIESPGHPAVYVAESPVAENQFHFWGRYDEFEERMAPVLNPQADSAEFGINRFAGRTAIYITDREIETIPLNPLHRTFAKWEWKTVFNYEKFGLPLRKVNVFLLYRYQPGKLLD